MLWPRGRRARGARPPQSACALPAECVCALVPSRALSPWLFARSCARIPRWMGGAEGWGVHVCARVCTRVSAVSRSHRHTFLRVCAGGRGGAPGPVQGEPREPGLGA